MCTVRPRSRERLLWDRRGAWPALCTSTGDSCCPDSPIDIQQHCGRVNSCHCLLGEVSLMEDVQRDPLRHRDAVDSHDTAQCATPCALGLVLFTPGVICMAQCANLCALSHTLPPLAPVRCRCLTVSLVAHPARLQLRARSGFPLLRLHATHASKLH